MNPKLGSAVAAMAVGLAAPAGALTLASTDIAPDRPIGPAHIYPRCGGQNQSPQLAWSGKPAGTKSFVLTMIDMDVQPDLWSHWIVVRLPATANALPRAARALPASAEAVKSNFGEAAYDGPCPPAGTGLHHYRFTIWAMGDKGVAIRPDEPARQVLVDLQAAAIGQASLTGTVQAAK